MLWEKQTTNMVYQTTSLLLQVSKNLFKEYYKFFNIYLHGIQYYGHNKINYQVKTYCVEKINSMVDAFTLS